jgi:ligand-binding SRPBCC domain-containing protein
MTEITAVKKYRLFVDEQRRGPYRLWHHQHLFREVANGVEMTDIVHYELPLGPLGNLANSLFVKKQLQSIFDYRTKVIVSKFGVSLPT